MVSMPAYFIKDGWMYIYSRSLGYCSLPYMRMKCG